MDSRRVGFLCMIAACVLWGFSTLYFHALRHVPPGEVLAWRVLSSLPLFLAILAVQGRVRSLPSAFNRKHRVRVAWAAVAVSSNWLMFILAVQAGHVVQSSLGYYIYPLAAVLLGVAIFGERLLPLQVAAVALAATAVALLTWGLGVAPWLSLGIAGTFAVYGAIKKGLALPPVLSVAAEVALLAPVAAGWLLLRPGESAPAFGSDAATTALLAASGVITAVPLMLFSAATRRIEMATVGVMQYLNPTIQFLCATLILREPFTGWHLLAFGLIWTAIALYSAAMLRRPARA